jgi:hypothetical protein
MRSNWCLVPLALMAISCGCTTSPSGLDLPKAEPISLTPAMVRSIENGLRVTMKDPQSLILGPVRAGVDRTSNTVVVCGYVNGRNSFGGYTGMQPFIGSAGTDTAGFRPADIGGDSNNQWAISTQCKLRGLPI